MLRLGATSITQISTLTVTPWNGFMNCSNSGAGSASCSSADPSGFAAANARAIASQGYVRVELNGGANLYGSTASASSRASNAETYLFTSGSGSGTLRYSVALTGFASGNPFEPASVLFNGTSYSVLPNAAPTYYSFTQGFTYGQPFLLTLSVEMASSWDGSRGDGGSRFASAQLVGTQVMGDGGMSAAVGPGAGGSEVPEPTTAMMWLGGVVLILFGLRRMGEQR